MVHSAKFHELDFFIFPEKKYSGGYVSIRLATLYRHLAFSAQTVYPRPKKPRKNVKKIPKIGQNPGLPPEIPGFCYFSAIFCYFPIKGSYET